MVSFSFNGKTLENTTEFTYMGIQIIAAGSLKSKIPFMRLKADHELAILYLNNRRKLSKLPINCFIYAFIQF